MESKAAERGRLGTATRGARPGEWQLPWEVARKAAKPRQGRIWPDINEPEHPAMRSRIYRSIPAVLLAACAIAAAAAIKIAEPPSAAENVISPTELREHLEFLASNELGGRYTLSPGLNIAARYLASRLEAYGYKPVGNDGSYFEHFDVISARPKPEECALGLTINGERSELKFGDLLLNAAHDGEATCQVVCAG